MHCTWDISKHPLKHIVLSCQVKVIKSRSKGTDVNFGLVGAMHVFKSDFRKKNVKMALKHLFKLSKAEVAFMTFKLVKSSRFSSKLKFCTHIIDMCHIGTRLLELKKNCWKIRKAKFLF